MDSKNSVERAIGAAASRSRAGNIPPFFNMDSLAGCERNGRNRDSDPGGVDCSGRGNGRIGDYSASLRQDARAGKTSTGTAALLVGMAMWLGWSAWIDHLSGGNYQLGGYLNSRFPHGMRNFFSYTHIVTGLSWVELAAVWSGAGALGLTVVAVTASARPLRAMAVAFRSVSCWVVLIVGSTGAAILTTRLMQWVPGRTLRVEMISLLARLAGVILVDVSVAASVMAISAACVRRSDAAYATPAGTPETSHERTAEIP